MSEQDNQAAQPQEDVAPTVDATAEAPAVSADTEAAANAEESAPQQDAPAVETVQDEPAAAPAVSTPPPAPEQKPTPPPVEQKAVVGNIDTLTVEEYVLVRMRHLKELPAQAKNIVARMQNYVDKMNTERAVGATDGALQQRELYFTILTALAAPDETVMPCLEAIAWYLNKYRGNCFGDGHAYRFMGQMKVTPQQLGDFQNLLYVLKLGANPASRKAAMGQVDLSRATGKMDDQRSREHLLAFLTT